MTDRIERVAQAQTEEADRRWLLRYLVTCWSVPPEAATAACDELLRSGRLGDVISKIQTRAKAELLREYGIGDRATEAMQSDD